MNKQAVDASRAPSSYFAYLPRVSPRAWAFDAPHFRAIAEHLDAVTRGEIDRLAIFLPPRHSKTETVTVRYPVYRMERAPTRCLITGYNDRIARRFSRKARTIAAERIGIAEKQTGIDEWATPHGSEMMARGVGSPPTGVGFDLINIDDPIRRREDAESEVYREKLWDWYTDDLYTRLEPNGAIILTVTLWHHDDLAARAIASEPGRWTVLRLPALAEDDDPLGRLPGAALWPERFPVESLERIRDVMAQNEGLSSWESLYQQNPSPREGSFFKVAKLGFVDELPANLRSCRAWDLAATPNGGDWTAGVKLAGPDKNGTWFVTDVVRGRWATDERNDQMRLAAETDGRACKIRIAQDPGQAGVDQVRALTRMLAGFPVRSERVTGPKVTRADPAASQVNAGNVRLLRADWNRDFIEELRQFPMGKHDDMTDSFADALNELAVGAKVGVVRWDS